jgi:hypothetical protein
MLRIISAGALGFSISSITEAANVSPVWAIMLIVSLIAYINLAAAQWAGYGR